MGIPCKNPAVHRARFLSEALEGSYFLVFLASRGCLHSLGFGHLNPSLNPESRMISSLVSLF